MSSLGVRSPWCVQIGWANESVNFLRKIETWFLSSELHSHARFRSTDSRAILGSVILRDKNELL